jgi:hypothetical protein
VPVTTVGLGLLPAAPLGIGPDTALLPSRPTTAGWEPYAAAAAIARDVTTYRGVDTATATLAGSRSAPTVHLDVAVETRASVADLRNRITDEVLPRLRTALRMDQLPAQLVLRLDAHDGTRRVH